MLTLLQGDWIDQLRTLPDNSVHCCVTSPPYWGLRDYGVPGQLGLEKTPEEYVAKMVAGFREVRRVLREDGTCWVNLGDTFAANRGYQVPDGKWVDVGNSKGMKASEIGLKPKDLVGIPWRVAFALQADGWWLRSDIIWCLSGGTWLYVRTDDSGECLMTVKDLYRIRGRGVMLWSGHNWTRLLGMSQSARKSDELEIVLRSGERISCTPTHKFPTVRGLLEAGQLHVGDILQRVQLPEPYPNIDGTIDADAAWFCGLYIAEGSRSGSAIQIAGHSKEESRWKRIQRVASKFGGSATRTVSGNKMDIRVYGRILHAIVDEFVTGRTAHDKGFSPMVWRRSNAFIAEMMLGYLSGDGHWEEQNRRWRLGFCRNYNLERDIRTACARLGWHLILKMSSVTYNGRQSPTFRGEIRMGRSGHWNQRDTAEIVEIRKARCRNVYDLGVCDESHLFALTSGILTHNSKPNPMPESVTDRPTKAHEYIFLLTKSERYFYDAEAIREPHQDKNVVDGRYIKSGVNRPDWTPNTQGFNGGGIVMKDREYNPAGRNKRTVWTVPSAPYKEAHFATYPPDLIKPCILAGTSARGCCPKCGAPWERVVDSKSDWEERKANGEPMRHGLDGAAKCGAGGFKSETKTLGWQPTCECGEQSTTPCTVLDPFGGSGTTGQVALELGRKAILIELNQEYVELIEQRTFVTPGLPLA